MGVKMVGIIWGILLFSGAAFSLDIRLPKSIIPEHYRIKMIPVLEDNDSRTFGSVKITVVVKEATDRVVLHGKGITVSDPASVTLLKNPQESVSEEAVELDPAVKIVNITYDDDKEFIILQLDKELIKDRRYSVAMNYKSVLENTLDGFYKSSYTERKTNKKKWLAVTQMEPTDARKAFPCFDEPAMKATFEIILGRKDSMSSLSNMPLRKTEAMRFNKGWVWDYFEQSVPMSTYLVACLVSDFQFRTGEAVVRSTQSDSDRTVANATEVRIWARPEAINNTQLAVDVTTKMLHFLESYFKVPFPLPKVDLVAIPDFSAGAMENWGLITFRETALLFDSKETVVRDKSYVQSVIAHELAHQWFGNLVTMNWWNDLWLNEGFASYVEDLVLEKVAPEFDIHVASVLEVQQVLSPDALESSHPISVEVEHPNQIAEIFDEISYKKGSAVIRMMHNFLGDDTFREGLANYLTTLKYRNARQDDLWQFLSEQAHRDEVLPPNLDVKTIMDTWTLQKGYPLVTITRNYQDGTLLIGQDRFIRPTAKSSSDIDFASVLLKKETETPRSESSPPYKWWIPISWTDSSVADFNPNNTRPKLWLSPDALSVQTTTNVNADAWILANVRVTGYFRVNYDITNWKLILQQLLRDPEVIHAGNRAQLIDDAFALASAEILPYSHPLDLIRYLPKETHYVPWTSAIRSLSFVRSMLLFTPHMGRWNTFVASLVIPAFEKVGFDIKEDDGPLNILVKVALNGQACVVGYKPCIKRAQELFAQWMESTDPVNNLAIYPDMRSTIYCNAIRYGGLKEWEFAWQMAMNVTSPQHRDVLLSALACSREPWILIRYLSNILDENSGIRKQDGRRVIGAVATNAVGRSFAYRFVKDNWDALIQYYGSVNSPMKMLSSVTSTFNEPSELDEVWAFLTKRSAGLSTSAASVKKIVTNIAANVQWMDNNFKVLDKWMESQQF